MHDTSLRGEPDKTLLRACYRAGTRLTSGDTTGDRPGHPWLGAALRGMLAHLTENHEQVT
jgi:hypothetical protein